MIRMIFRLIFLAVIAGLIFIGISIYSGGEKFRWFGKKVEQQSEKVGEKADRIKQGSEKVVKGVEKTTEKVREITGSKNDRKDEKSR